MGRRRSSCFALAVAALAACRPDSSASPRSEPPAPQLPPTVAPPPTPAEAPPAAMPAAAPAAVAHPPSPYCLMGLEQPCGCDELARLVSRTDVLSPAELAWAAAQFAAVAPTALPRAASARTVIASGVSCVALTGGKLYCRAHLEGVAKGELPVALAVSSACAPSGRCIELRFDVVRACPSEGGAVTAWADVHGVSALWGPGDARPVPGGVPP